VSLVSSAERMTELGDFKEACWSHHNVLRR